MLKRRLTRAVLCAMTAALGVVGSAGADASGGANHVVIAQNTTDGATVVHAGTQVVPTASDTVTSANIAAAVNAGCVGCHSTAVAVQILIVHGSPYFTPGNVAGAANGGCDSCGAFAYARQHWIQVAGNTELSGAARAQVAELRQEIAAAASSILPSDATTDPCVTTMDCPTRDEQLNAELTALSDELIQVVTNDLQNQGDTTSTLLDRVQNQG